MTSALDETLLEFAPNPVKFSPALAPVGCGGARVRSAGGAGRGRGQCARGVLWLRCSGAASVASMPPKVRDGNVGSAGKDSGRGGGRGGVAGGAGGAGASRNPRNADGKKGKTGDASSDETRQQTISSLIKKYSFPARSEASRSPSKRRRQQRSSSEPDDPSGDPGDLGMGSRDQAVELRAPAGPLSRPARGDGSSGSGLPEGAELAELIRGVVRSELGLATATLQRSFKEAIDALGERIQELEGRLFEKDEEIERLSRELTRSQEETEELVDTVDHLETEMRQSTLIISGPAVPAPPRREGDGPRQPENVVPLAVSVINKAMPDVTVNDGDIASCFRVGGLQKLVCRFVRSGPGSTRDAVYQGRFQLMSQRDESQRLYIAESLSRRRQQCMSTLLAAKKRQQIYTVFTKNGVVFYKERKDGATIRADYPGQISRFR